MMGNGGTVGYQGYQGQPSAAVAADTPMLQQLAMLCELSAGMHSELSRLEVDLGISFPAGTDSAVSKQPTNATELLTLLTQSIRFAYDRVSAVNRRVSGESAGGIVN